MNGELQGDLIDPCLSLGRINQACTLSIQTPIAVAEETSDDVRSLLRNVSDPCQEKSEPRHLRGVLHRTFFSYLQHACTIASYYSYFVFSPSNAGANKAKRLSPSPLTVAPFCAATRSHNLILPSKHLLPVHLHNFHGDVRVAVHAHSSSVPTVPICRTSLMPHAGPRNLSHQRRIRALLSSTTAKGRRRRRVEMRRGLLRVVRLMPKIRGKLQPSSLQTPRKSQILER